MKAPSAVLSVALLLPLACATRGQIPGLPYPPVKLPVSIPSADSLPGLDKLLAQEPPITTSLDDVLPDAPFLDNFAPAQTTPLTQLPRGVNGIFYLYPGTYWFEAKSYCLRAGTYGPGRGDAYFYAPLQGSKSAIVRHVLQRSVVHPEIPQADVQELLWAIIARTKVSDMSPDRQRKAARLLTPAEILDLNGYGLGPLSDAARAYALANLPEPISRALDAENRLRQMVASAETPYEDIERVAVLAGAAPPDSEGRQAPATRWSYHPGGYFIRFQPHNYSSTRIELYVPEQAPVVERDSRGRITSVHDPRTSSLNPGRPEQRRFVANRGPQGSDPSDTRVAVRPPLRQFDPSDGPAIPGNRNAQRLGMSGGKSGEGGSEQFGGEVRHAQYYVEGGKFGVEWAIEGFKHALGSAWGFLIPNLMFHKILGFNYDTWGKVSEELVPPDPPDSNYKTYAKIETLTFVPLTPGPDLPPARAAVANSLMGAALDLSATLRAAMASFDRLGGANQAGDTVWGWRQGEALMYYKREAGTAMLTVADRLDAMINEFRNEGVQDFVVVPEMVREYQAQLRTTGFSAEDLQAAHAIKLTDQEIEGIKQRRIASDPATVAGSLIDAATEYAAALRTVGNLFSTLPAVLPPWTEGANR